MVAAISAKVNRKVVCCDIGGAYLNAEMTDDVYMRIDPLLTAFIRKLKPDYERFICPNG